MTNEQVTLASLAGMYLTVLQEDNSLLAVPVELIARHRAAHYAERYAGSVDQSMLDDTIPLFLANPFEVEDWAANNMNWSEVASSAITLRPANIDRDEAWANGEKSVIRRADVQAEDDDGLTWPGESEVVA